MAQGPALVISSMQKVCVGVLLENSALQAMPLEPAPGNVGLFLITADLPLAQNLYLTLVLI